MLSLPAIALLLSLLRLSAAASDDRAPPKPCTIHSPTTGSFIDIRPLQLIPLDNSDKKHSGTSHPSPPTNESYHAKGYDYPYNFTLNLCDAVVEPLEKVQGVKESRWANVSAYYTDSHSKIHSIGQQNDELLFRGKKLLLNYTMGSPCPDLDEDGEPLLSKREIIHDDPDDDEDDDDDRKSHKPTANQRRKSTLLTFTCDTSPQLATRPAISFLGTPDHCAYIFEIRSRHACGGTTASHESGTLGPGGVFLVISGIALAVYVIGGVVYQRNVMHQRGWRQLPNYAMWAGLFGFVSVL
jgi:cation-dependent mannose-6-phosphate receptor